MPRAGLNRDAVVEAAERFLDEHGPDRLTLSALADSLGVRQPSLYKHIDSVDGLHRSLSARARSELAGVLGRAAVGRSGPDAVREFATAYRHWALEHPGRYPLTLRAPDPDDEAGRTASEAVLAVVLDVLAGFGLAGDDAIDATRALRAALHGFVALEAAGGFGLPQDVGRSFDRLVAGLVRLLAAGAW